MNDEEKAHILDKYPAPRASDLLAQVMLELGREASKEEVLAEFAVRVRKDR